MFLWQFPHFMAIAWLYRDDYARGGQKMLTVVDPTGLRAAGQAIVAAMAAGAGEPGAGARRRKRAARSFTVSGRSCSASAQVAAAVWFLTRRDDLSARWLLRASLVYLTCWMGLLGDGRRVARVTCLNTRTLNPRTSPHDRSFPPTSEA